MQKGLEFFKLKAGENDFESLRKDLDLELPEKYILFTSLFEMGEGELRSPKFLDPKFPTPSECGSILIKPNNFKGEYLFSGFFNQKELKRDWNNYSKDSAEFLNHGLLRIATIGIGGGIFLGLKGSKRDQVFLVNWDSDEDYQLLAENIFEFPKLLFFNEDNINLGPDREYSQLYKNWGEDFWRVRE